MENPTFIKIDEYKEVLGILAVLKEKVNEAKLTLKSINDLKRQEDDELDNWTENISTVEERIQALHDALSTGQK
ncbi:MAG: hypothetical protein H6502_01140 [Candidatus Woesearchaeota archaeon]|nr:MAG: hypothetical protein H6502_01140 [Candidatus Woesearchaeota archaeon]